MKHLVEQLVVGGLFFPGNSLIIEDKLNSLRYQSKIVNFKVFIDWTNDKYPVETIY